MNEEQKGPAYRQPSEEEIARRALVALLELDVQLHKWTRQVNSVPGLSVRLPVNPLQEVLDALGCPADSSIQVAEDDPGFFCRDWLAQEWYDQLRGEKPFDPGGYIDWVRSVLRQSS